MMGTLFTSAVRFLFFVGCEEVATKVRQRITNNDINKWIEF